MRTIDQMIQSEVLCCVSSLVSTLCSNPELTDFSEGDLGVLCEQAFALASPIDDWEEAAFQEGWELSASQGYINTKTDVRSEQLTWFDLCEEQSLEPYQRDVFEHWAVTNWFADKLEAAGEKVDRDFAGLNVWARTTTGQQIAADGVIERIYEACKA